jgi:spore maturation protein CgeB
MTMENGARRNTVFENNLSALRDMDPALAESLAGQTRGADLEIVEAKSGMPSLKVNRIALHSLYDPVKETREWAAHHEKEIQGASSVFIVGFGLGYHVLEACKGSGRNITVFEPRLDILRTALESLCLTPALSRIRIVTDDKIPSFDRDTVILQHTPSVNANREYFRHLLSRLKSRQRIHKGLKVLVVSPVYGGSLPIARYCSGTLRKMGHTVEFIDNSRFEDALFYAQGITKNKLTYGRLADKLSEFLSEAVLARCEIFRPDLVLALAQAPLTPECLRHVRESGIPTAFWFVEDFRLMNYWRNVAGCYDYFFTIQKDDFFEELLNAGIRNFHYLPLAADPHMHKKTEVTDEEKKYYGSDVSFVGAGYYNRRHLFKGLLDYDFKIWGTDWDMNSALAACVQRAGGRVDTEETALIFNASTININLHSSTYHRGINPFGDFVNPRTFEIAACGGFQLADRRSEMKGLFKEGEEIVFFEDLEDLRKKINHYLENPEERHRIAEKARQRVLREHTYENRMKDMLGFLADRDFQPGSGDGEGEVLTELIAEAAADRDLAEHLSRFSGKERITLTDIVQDIEASKGDLTKAETLFLVMNEFLK